ncbi:MAG TPA: thiamine phosphate synthase [Candidatus Binataceae bacterium]|nr:thiamine phosphate synthase [Candidatus Binataceae bacterium]
MDQRSVNFSLYLISDRKLAAAHGGLLAVIEAALQAAGDAARTEAIAVQLREKDLGGRELYELAIALLPICHRHAAPLLINDRLDVAIAVGADGVHLPSDGVPARDARRLLGPSALIGISTHQAGEVEAAACGGPNFAVFGPVFDPLSKPAHGVAGGAESHGAACRLASVPVYSLGGITAERIHRLRGTGAFAEGARPAGVAVIGAVMGADHPGAATRALLEALAGWR